MRFDEFGFDPALMLGIRDMRYQEATPIQEQAIPAVIGGRDVIGLAQTGTGKTAAFLLPILQKVLPGNTGVTRALILAPTRELASQIDDVRVGLTYHTSISGALVLGGANADTQERALKGVPDIVIATPGRLLDFLFRGLPKLDKIEIVVLDEADRMLDMGFLPDIEKILRRLPDNRQNLMFSATMPPPIEKLAREIMRNPVTISIGARSRPVDRIRHIFERIQPQYKARRLGDALRDRTMESVIVFTKTKSGADRLWRDLLRCGIQDCIAIHGDRTQQERFHALELFKSRQIRVLIATDVAARGIDVDSVSHVVNYDLPRTFEDYVHRVGRTARAGESGIAVTLVTPEEERAARRYEQAIDEMRAKSRSARADASAEPPRPDDRPNEARRDERPRDDSRREAPRREEGRRDDGHRGEPRRHEPRRDDGHRGGSRRDEPRRDEPSRVEREQAPPRRDDRGKHEARPDRHDRHEPRHRSDRTPQRESAHAEHRQSASDRPREDARRDERRPHERRGEAPRRDDRAPERQRHEERPRVDSRRAEESRRDGHHEHRDRRPEGNRSGERSRVAESEPAARSESRPPRVDREPRREEPTRRSESAPPMPRERERAHPPERPAREPAREKRTERPEPARARREENAAPTPPPVSETAPTKKARKKPEPRTEVDGSAPEPPAAKPPRAAKKTTTRKKKSVLDDEIPTTTGPDD